MMRIQIVLQGGLAAAVMVAISGCGDDKSETSGFSGYATFPTPSTNPTSLGTTQDATTSVDSEGTTDSSTSPVDPPTSSTGVDPTTTTAPPMTSTTTTTMPMTTDPSTTSTTTTMPMTTDDTSTSSSTTDDTSSSSTTTTTMGMTTDPPPKDPQPAAGLFSSCWPGEMCTGADGCLTLQDADMVKFDGFCTDLCVTAADCIPKPNGPAVAKCLAISVDQTACFLECVTEADCPTGMTCEAVALPNGDGNYCW